MGMRATSPPSNAEPDTFLNCILVGCKTGDSTLSIYYAGSTVQTAISLGPNFPCTVSNEDIYTVTLEAVSNTRDVLYTVTRINTGHVAEGTLTAATAGVQLPSNTTMLCFQGYQVSHPSIIGNANIHMLGFESEIGF
jgi:hypothetical protein